MRESLLIFLLLLILVSCQASDEENNIEPSLIKSDYTTLHYKVDDSSTHLSISLEKREYVKPVESINLIIENRGNTDIYFGSSYEVEKYVDGQWFKVPFKDNIAFADIALYLKAGQTDTHNINLGFLDHQFNQGKYRIIEDFFNSDENATVEGTKITLAVEFEIKR